MHLPKRRREDRTAKAAIFDIICILQKAISMQDIVIKKCPNLHLDFKEYIRKVCLYDVHAMIMFLTHILL